MSKEKYTELIKGFRELAGIEEAIESQSLANISIGEVDFTLIPPMTDDQTMADILCDFGRVPDENKVEILQHLLEANLLVSGSIASLTGGSCSFGLNPENNRAVLYFRWPFLGATAESMVMFLQMMTEEALSWRETHYLEKTNLSKQNREYREVA